MNNANHIPIPAAIEAGRIIAIGRGIGPDQVLALAEGLVAGGVHAFEITLNSPNALRSITALATRFADDALVVGAGTVMSVAEVLAAHDAGARFIVMPHTDPALIDQALRLGLASFPGVFTPTEAISAWRSGASAVKLFPASAAGPSFVRELHGPFPSIPVVPTGGVTADTAPAFIAAGAVAVGIGSWLTGSGDPEEVRSRAAQLTAAVIRS